VVVQVCLGRRGGMVVVVVCAGVEPTAKMARVQADNIRRDIQSWRKRRRATLGGRGGG